MLVAISCVSAYDTSLLSFNVTVGEPVNVNIRLTNNASYDFKGVHLVSDYATASDFDLMVGESKDVPVVFTASDYGQVSGTLKFLAYREVPCGSLAPSSFSVNVTEDGVDPERLDLCVGSSVVWNNNFYSWIKLKVYPDTDFTGPIQNGSSFSRTFSSPVDFTYEVFPLIPGGHVVVSDSSVKVHSSDLDINVPFSVFASYKPTSLLVSSISATSFTVNYNGEGSGFIVLSNIGNVSATNVVLGGKWLSFDSNAFTLLQGASKAVNFAVTPSVLSSSDTNRTEVVSLVVSSDNSEPVYQNISVFVPFSAVVSDNVSSADFWISKMAFCDKYSSSPWCITKPVEVVRLVPEFACPDVLVNMSPKDIQDYMRSGLRSDDDNKRLYNLIRQYLDNQSNMNDVNFRVNNGTLSEVVELKKSSDDFNESLSTIFFILLFVIVLALACFTAYTFLKRKGREASENGS